MKAVYFEQGGDASVLTVKEVEKPTASGHDLVVKLHAVSFNPIDAKVRKEPSPNQHIAGYDGAGVVESVGPDCTLFKTGDEVYFAGSVIRTGCHAEYVAIDERIVGRKPSNLTWEQAAGIPLVLLTGWEALLEQLAIPEKSASSAEKSILVLGGAGGTGSIGVQIAKKILGLKVYATASRPESIEYARSMGADVIIDHNKDLAEQIPEGVDYVYCTNDPDAALENGLIKLIKPFGKIVSILPLFKAHNTAPLFQKRATLCFELMFTRPIFGIELEKQGAILNRGAELLESGVFQHTVTKVLPSLFDGGYTEGHAFVESGRAIGKISATVA